MTLKGETIWQHHESGTAVYLRGAVPTEVKVLPKGYIKSVDCVPVHIVLDATPSPTGVKVELEPGGAWTLCGGGLATALAETHCKCCMSE